MAKQVQFGTRPVRRPTAEELDQFVQGAGKGGPPPVLPQQPPQPQQLDSLPQETAVAPAKPARPPMKRLTFDIPADLHRRMRVTCVTEGRDMAEVIRDMLMQRFPPDRRN